MKRVVILFLLIQSSYAGFCQSIPRWKITDLVNYYHKDSDSIYVINFWSTWCQPCVEEIPFMQKISNKHAGNKVKLLLVSLDLYKLYPDKLKAFAKKHRFTSDLVWLDETDADIFCPAIDKKWSGAVPATLIYNAKTGYNYFFEGKFSVLQFEQELKKAIEGRMEINGSAIPPNKQNDQR